MEEKFCMFCGKPLEGNTQKKFCSCSCSAMYNNKQRRLTTKGKKKLVKCIVCGNEFWASIHINTTKCKCENCKKHNRKHYNPDPKSIKDMSSKTTAKLIKRAGLGCSICGWKESSLDIHHIIPKKEGGTNDNENLIMLCPNCHRIVHTTNKYTREYLQSLSIDKVFVNWKEFYHTER